MDGRVALPVAAMVAAAALAGCFGEASQSTPPPPPATSSFLASPEEIASVPPPVEEGEEAPPPPPDAPGTIEGMVVEKGGYPLVGARVTILESVQRDGELALYNETDANGSFAFPPLRPGHYTLVPELRGFDSLRMLVPLQPAQRMYVVMHLERLPPVNVTRNETWEFGGFIACGVATAGAMLMPCVGDANQRTRFAVNVTWGIENLVVAVDWAGDVQLGVALRATQGVHGRPECEALGTAAGPPPLVVRVERECLEFAVTHEKDRDVPVEVRVTPKANETQPYTLVVQQSFKVYANAFYVEGAPASFTGLPE